MRVVLVIHVVAFLLATTSFANVKSFKPSKDDIVEIRMGLGIATIVQFPETIQSAVIGDQSAYRVEYMDKAVTIKPLRSGAKTNLYLFTKDQRYNLRLNVVPQASAYYIVYINKAEPGNSVRWISMNKVVTIKDHYSIKLVRVGLTNDEYLLLDFSVTAKRSMKIVPDDIWILQGRDSVAMQGLFLSRSDLKGNQTVKIAISIRREVVKDKELVMELRVGVKPAAISVPRVTLWK